MSETIIVTLQHPSAPQSCDLALPTQVLIQKLLPLIIKVNGWPDPSSDVDCRLRSENSGRVLRADLTLGEAGIVSGDILSIISSVPFLDAQPHLEEIVISGAALVGIHGQVFHLEERSVLVGRPDPPNPLPQIDLTDFDPDVVSSREHAHIWLSEGSYLIEDLGSSNGTFVDGSQLRSGIRLRLSDGNQIHFGKGGPVFVFRLGSAKPE